MHTYSTEQSAGGILLASQPSGRRGESINTPAPADTTTSSASRFLPPPQKEYTANNLAESPSVSGAPLLGFQVDALTQMLDMITNGTPGASFAMDDSAATMQVDGASSAASPLDHFQVFVNSPQALSSPRSPISARDFSPELPSREYSPDAETPEHEHAMVHEDDADVTLRAVPRRPTASAEEEWTTYLEHSALFGSHHTACTKEQQDAEEFELLSAQFFDANTTKISNNEQQPAPMINVAAAVAPPTVTEQAGPVLFAGSTSLGTSQSSSLLDIPATVPNVNGANFLSARYGPVSRSSSQSSIDSHYSSSTDASMDSVLAVARPNGNGNHQSSRASSPLPQFDGLYAAPFSPSSSMSSSTSSLFDARQQPMAPSLASFTKGSTSEAATTATLGSATSLINARMLESACRTVYNLILDGHSPETIDEFNQKLYSVTGQLVPMRVVLEAQKARNELLWNHSNHGSDVESLRRRGSGSASDDGSGASSFGAASSQSDSDSEYAPPTKQRAVSAGHLQQQPSTATLFVNSNGVVNAHDNSNNSTFNMFTNKVQHPPRRVVSESAAASPRMRSSTTVAIRRGPLGNAVANVATGAPSPVSASSPGRSVASPSQAAPRRRHAPLQQSKKRFSCTHCSKAFDRAFNLKTHMATHDAERDKPYVCPLDGCGRDFARKHDCQRHVRTVHIKRGEATAQLLEQIVHLHGDEDAEEEQQLNAEASD